jgi:hypothetical protein
MQFDGARSRFKSGAGVVLTTPSGMIFPFSFCLEFDCTNNMEVYEALLSRTSASKKDGNQAAEGRGGFKTCCKPGKDAMQSKESLIEEI